VKKINQQYGVSYFVPILLQKNPLTKPPVKKCVNNKHATITPEKKRNNQQPREQNYIPEKTDDVDTTSLVK
jgi:hypothetical protein